MEVIAASNHAELHLMLVLTIGLYSIIFKVVPPLLVDIV